MSNATALTNWFDQVWGQRNKAVIDEMLHADFQVFGINPGGPLSRDDFKGVWQRFITTYPDIHIEITHTMESGDQVAYHALVTGTHANTNQPVRFAGTGIVTFQGGKVIESRETWDFLSMLTQNGAIEPDVVAREM